MTTEGEDNKEQDAPPAADAAAPAADAAAPAADAAADAAAPAATTLNIDWTQLNKAEDGTAICAPPAIRYPCDVVDDLHPSETEVVIVGTAGQKITHMGKDLSSKQLNPKLKTLILRSHLITTMEGLGHFECLDLLELYDNQITDLNDLDNNNDNGNNLPGKTLRVLDMSYNSIRDMAPVAVCINLQELYLANNKLKTMAGLSPLAQLKKIDLGANRIRVMDPDELSGLVNLEELWLGKNKIEKIQGLDNLKKLRRLDIQSNRITVIENLEAQNDTLEELYLAHNGIASVSSSTTAEGGEEIDGCNNLRTLTFPNLSVLDLSRNRLTSTAAFAHLTSLDELWLSGNQISSFEEVEPLKALGSSLETIYLEYNPLQNNDPLYRKTLKELIPSLQQIDANRITAANLLPATSTTTTTTSTRPVPQPPRPALLQTDAAAARPGETEDERLRRLQDMIVERAKHDTAAVGQPPKPNE